MARRRPGSLLGAALGAVTLLLVGVAGAETYYLLAAPATVSAERPVVVGDLAARAVVDTAAQDLTEITSTSYRNYDEQVEQATRMMTEEYAAEFRTMTGGLRDDFEAAKREVASAVVLSGVVSASPTTVQALLFLDQDVSEGGEPPVRRPYRALVTMTHTSDGWLVSAIETR